MSSEMEREIEKQDAEARARKAAIDAAWVVAQTEISAFRDHVRNLGNPDLRQWASFVGNKPDVRGWVIDHGDTVLTVDNELLRLHVPRGNAQGQILYSNWLQGNYRDAGQATLLSEPPSDLAALLAATIRRIRDLPPSSVPDSSQSAQYDLIAAVSDPIERLIRALARVHSERYGTFASSDARTRMCPDVWPPGSEFESSDTIAWDSDQIANWFLDHVSGEPHSSFTVPVRKRLLLGGTKRIGSKSEPAWKFKGGSTIERNSFDPWSESGFADAYILLSGQILINGRYGDPIPTELNEEALATMAQLLRLEPLKT